MYAKSLYIADPRTGFATHFNPTENNAAPSEADFRSMLHRIPSKQWANEGASVRRETMPPASAYAPGASRGAAGWLPFAQQMHDADRRMFADHEVGAAGALGEGSVFADSPAFRERYERIIENDDPIDMCVRLAFMYTEITERNLVRMCECDWSVKPFGVLGVMPRDFHDMGGALAVRGGPELGATMYGHMDTKQGVDPVHKMVMYNMTWYHKAVVKQPKWVIRTDSLYYLRYLGGHNSRAATEEEVRTWHSRNFNPPESREDWSWIFMLVPHTEDFERSKFIDLRGFAVGSERSNFNSARDRANPHYSTAAYYDALFHFTEMPAQELGMRLFYQNSYAPNSLCVRGPWREFNVHDGKFSIERKNQGHHGPLVGPGVGKVRNGQVKSLKEALAPMGPGWAA